MTERPPATKGGPNWGWIAGLGVVPFSWFSAGVISTFLPDPEAGFPWVLLVSFGLSIGALAWGSVRITGFRRVALIGSAISMGAVTLLYLMIRLLQP